MNKSKIVRNNPSDSLTLTIKSVYYRRKDDKVNSMVRARMDMTSHDLSYVWLTINTIKTTKKTEIEVMSKLN